MVNDCYPGSKEINSPVQISYESFVEGITQRGMDSFTANGPQVILDTTDFGRLDREDLVRRIQDIVQAVPFYLQHSVGDVKVRSCPVPKNALIRECCYYTYPQRG